MSFERPEVVVWLGGYRRGSNLGWIDRYQPFRVGRTGVDGAYCMRPERWRESGDVV
ncbi:MAG: hypothetical protein KDB00_14880 [Planctomycetales bacterium]|nr:hypothetical protein [Planctomycetales bacterium]